MSAPGGGVAALAGVPDPGGCLTQEGVCSGGVCSGGSASDTPPCEQNDRQV